MLNRAILIADHPTGPMRGTPARAGCLDRLVDRSWLHHVIEQLCAGGVDGVDVLAGDGASRIVDALGDGERWGVSIRCHRVEGGEAVDRALAHLADEPDLLLAEASAIVAAPHWQAPPSGRASVILYQQARMRSGQSQLEWTGWCRGPTRQLLDAARHRTRNDTLAALLGGDAAVSSVVCAALSAHDVEELLEANQAVLSGRAEFVSPRGRSGPGGVWTGRRVRLHRTARVTGPVYIGDHCDVGPGVVLGPNVVLGDGCVVEPGATAQNCVLAPGTYVSAGARCERVLEVEPHGHWRAVSGGSLEPFTAELVDLRAGSLLASLLRSTWSAIYRVITPFTGWARATAAWFGRAPHAGPAESTELASYGNHAHALPH